MFDSFSHRTVSFAGRSGCTTPLSVSPGSQQWRHSHEALQAGRAARRAHQRPAAPADAPAVLSLLAAAAGSAELAEAPRQPVAARAEHVQAALRPVQHDGAAPAAAAAGPAAEHCPAGRPRAAAADDESAAALAASQLGGPDGRARRDEHALPGGDGAGAAERRHAVQRGQRGAPERPDAAADTDRPVGVHANLVHFASGKPAEAVQRQYQRGGRRGRMRVVVSTQRRRRLDDERHTANDQVRGDVHQHEARRPGDGHQKRTHPEDREHHGLERESQLFDSHGREGDRRCCEVSVRHGSTIISIRSSK